MTNPQPTMVPHFYEWEYLWHWHRDEQFECADKEKYNEAEDHRRRADEIRKTLDARKEKQNVHT